MFFSIILIVVSSNVTKTVILVDRNNREYIRDFQDYKIVSALIESTINSSCKIKEFNKDKLVINKNILEGSRLITKKYNLYMYYGNLIFEISNGTTLLNRMVLSEIVENISVNVDNNLIEVELKYKKFNGKVTIFARK